MHVPRVTFESDLGHDDPFKQVLERWLGQEFPALGGATTEDTMIAVVNEFISTKQYRVGPRPAPESEVMIRRAVREHVEAGHVVPVLIPSAAVKLPFGARLDLAELSALRVLGCLQERVKRHYAPGLAVRVRLEDLTELTISPEVHHVRQLTESYVRDFRNLVDVLGFSAWLTVVPESALVQEEAWQRLTAELTTAFAYHLDTTATTPEVEVRGALARYGWQGGVGSAMREYLTARYRKLYPATSASEHTVLMARYLAAILARRHLGATGAVNDGPRLEITFANPLPDAPRFSTRVQYRTAPRHQAGLALPYWAAKGYLTLDEEDAPHITLAHATTPVPGLTHGQLTLTTKEGLSAELQADYLQG